MLFPMGGLQTDSLFILLTLKQKVCAIIYIILKRLNSAPDPEYAVEKNDGGSNVNLDYLWL